MPPRGNSNDAGGGSSTATSNDMTPTSSSSKSSSKKQQQQQQQQHKNDHAARIRAAAAAPTNATIVVDSSSNPVDTLLAANRDLAVVSLTLRDLPITHDVADAFQKVLRGQGRSWEGMAVDILRRQSNASTSIDGIHARWQTITLQDITIQSNNNDDDSASTIISTILALDNCRNFHLCNVQLSPYAATSLGRHIGHCQALHTLSLDLLDLNVPTAIPGVTTISLLADGLRRMASSSLQILECCRCGLNDSQLVEILDAVTTASLRQLKLFGNKCRQGGLASITKLLATPDTQLAVLDISYQHVVVNDDENSFDISWLCSALATNKSLRTLDLDNDGIDDGHLAHLVAALSTTNTTLNEIMLNHNKITGDGVALLAANFTKMKGLKKISMYSNQFG